MVGSNSTIDSQMNSSFRSPAAKTGPHGHGGWAFTFPGVLAWWGCAGLWPPVAKFCYSSGGNTLGVTWSTNHMQTMVTLHMGPLQPPWETCAFALKAVDWQHFCWAFQCALSYCIQTIVTLHIELHVNNCYVAHGVIATTMGDMCICIQGCRSATLLLGFSMCFGLLHQQCIGLIGTGGKGVQ